MTIDFVIAMVLTMLGFVLSCFMFSGALLARKAWIKVLGSILFFPPAAFLGMMTCLMLLAAFGSL